MKNKMSYIDMASEEEKELFLKVIIPRSMNDDSLIYVLYRRLFSCIRGKHRFMYVDAEDSDFCTLTHGNYYCMDCGKKSTPAEIPQYWEKGSDVWGNDFYEDLMMQRVSVKRLL